MKFQEIILALQKFWSEQGCILAQPYDDEPLDLFACTWPGAVERGLC